MLKKILLSLIFLLIPIFSQAQDRLEVYFFYSDSCPHCHKEALFLDELEDEYGSKIKISRLEINQDDTNLATMLAMARQLGVGVSGVPFTVIGDKYFVGYYNDEITGRQIREVIDTLVDIPVNNIILPTKPIGQPESNGEQKLIVVADDVTNQKTVENNLENKIEIPLLGKIDIKDFSLPLLSIVLGFVDGFNPCAMWALVFLISLLLGMENRKRMWILGISFIITSSLVYFLFMVAWLNIFLFLGLVWWLRMLIGCLALAGGGYNLREFFKNKAGTCKLDGHEKKKRIFDKLRDITAQKSFYLSLFGIILLAIAVNMVELICSAGLPAVYTQVLALNDLGSWQYYGYILLYIFFFMLDDLLVFFIAMITMQLTGFSTKYSRYSSLLGAILMILIGLLLLFRYDLLMFS